MDMKAAILLYNSKALGMYHHSSGGNDALLNDAQRYNNKELKVASKHRLIKYSQRLYSYQERVGRFHLEFECTGLEESPIKNPSPSVKDLVAVSSNLQDRLLLNGSSRPSSPIRHHVHRGKVPGNLNTKDYESTSTNHSPATRYQQALHQQKFSSQKVHILIHSELSVLV